LATPRLSRKAAREAVRYVEKALRDGYQLNGIPSAIEEAARRFTKINRKLSRGAFQTRVRVAKNLHGIEPKLPKDPKQLPAQARARIAPPEEHAHTRARSLSEEITRLVTSSRYPLINPKAILVESYLTRVYDRRLKDYRLVEGRPRTWLSGTLRVSAVPKSKGRRFLFTGAQNDAPVHQGF
jgi:hypothetical protein